MTKDRHDNHDHPHEGSGPLSDIALRVKALEDLLIEKAVVDRAALDKILASEEWARLKKKLLTFVTNFTYKIVPYTGNFQL